MKLSLGLVTFVALSTLGSGLKVDVFSDDNCKKKTGSYNCDSVWNKCHQMSHSIRSYYITESSSGCNSNGAAVFNNFFFYSTKKGCAPGKNNALGCNKGKCYKTWGNNFAKDPVPSWSIKCALDFNMK